MSEDAPFPRSTSDMTLTEMQLTLEYIADECRATAEEAKGEDAEYVTNILVEVAKNVEAAHTLLKLLAEKRDQN